MFQRTLTLHNNYVFGCSATVFADRSHSFEKRRKRKEERERERIDECIECIINASKGETQREREK